MKLRRRISCAATFALAMSVCATPTLDESPVVEIGQMPGTSEFQDEIEE